MSDKLESHKNDEKAVECPVEGCKDEVLARGLHLHVRQSGSGNHGTSGEVPDDVDLEAAKEAGTQEVEMDYPESRDSEKVARLCPYCERPFRGKHGVMIHLGQIKGRKDHPEDGPDRHEPEDFDIVEVDNKGNIEKVIEQGDEESLPTTEQRKESESEQSVERINKHIEDLRERGLEEEAERAEKMLLGK